MLKLDDVLLTELEGSDALTKGFALAEEHSLNEDNTDKVLECIFSARKERDKAQCLKILKILEDNGKIYHQHIGGIDFTKHPPSRKLYKDCWLCELKRHLSSI